MKDCIDEGTLQAWCDGELPALEAAQVAAHLNNCAQCAESASTVESENLILSEALANEFAAAIPSERLRQRVDAAVTDLQGASITKVTESRWRGFAEFLGSFRPLAYASVAAMILVAAIIGVVYMKKEKATPTTLVQNNTLKVTPTSPTGPEPVTSPKPAPSKSPEIQRVNFTEPVKRTKAPEPDATSLLWQEQQYKYAIAKLDEAIKIQPPLRPALQVEYDYNMAVIDNAIATGRDAAKKNPKDPQAAQSVLTAYQNKVDLMNQIADARVLEK